MRPQNPTSPGSYFERVATGQFRATEHVGGGWNPDEQHIAPAIGLLAHVIETDRDRRRDDGLQLSRLSCDILGTLPIDVIDIELTILRPGRTIELIEARLGHGGRTAAIARAWLTQGYDTTSLAVTRLPSIAPPEDMSPWSFGDHWPGGFVRSLHAQRAEDEPGRASYWLRTDLALIADEPVSRTAAALGLVDAANGATPPVSAERAAFPNLDLTAHLFRPPTGEWIGFDTAVSFGPHGAGLTHSTIHDHTGPFGTVAQTLTVRPRTGDPS